MTWIGYENNYAGSTWVRGAEINFWSTTHTPIASYHSYSIASPLERDPHKVVYGKITPMTLDAGQVYYVTLDFGSSTSLPIEVYSPDLSDPLIRPFQAAPEITYLGAYDYNLAAGTLKSYDPFSRGLLLGPTFRFQADSNVLPRVTIHAIGGAVVLAWPTNAPDFIVETSASPASIIWESVNTSPVVLGGNFTVTGPWADPARFFRLRAR